MADRQSSWGKWILILAGCIAVIAGALWYFHRNRDGAVQYETVAVVRGDLTNEVAATGTLNPVTNVLVGCQVSGTISKIYVDYNSLVKSGQLIAELDPSQYKAQLEQSEANLANAKANLELQQVQAQRESELFTNKLVDGADYDTAIATLHEAEATVKLDQAAVNMAQVNLGYCKIYSPVDGIVIVNNIEVGQTVAASFNTPELFQIATDLKQMQIDSSVAEADVGGIIQGQDVDFTVDAYPYRTFRGQVTQVRNSPTTVNNVVTYDCVISVTNADYKLKPGMTANVSIIISRHKNTLEVPNAAFRVHPPETAMIITNAPAAQMAVASGTGGHPHHHDHADGGQSMARTVFVLAREGNDDKLEAVQIKTGINDGIHTEVLDGLKEGDNVVTSATSPTESGQNGNPFGGMPRFR